MNDRVAPADPALAPIPTPTQLFLGFLQITVSGFGGVLAWARRVIVLERRWMSAEEFNELFALCQFLPGPNIVNFSIIYGARIRGFSGAAAALTGLMVPPILLMIVAGTLYMRYGALPELHGALTGLAAAAAGLLIATAAQMAAPLARGGFGIGPVLAAATFVAVGVLKWPLLVVLALMVPVSVGISWGKSGER